MAYADWPLAVPFRSERQPWGVTPWRAPIETEMSGGNTRTRRRPGDDVATMKWGRMLTAAQWAALQSFLLTGGAYASLFWMPVCLDGGLYELRLVRLTGGAPAVSSAGGDQVTVSMTLLVMPAIMTPAVPVLTAVGDAVTGTGATGQVVEISFGGLVSRSVTVAAGVFSVPTPFLPDGAHPVRARYAGGPWSVPMVLAMPTELMRTLHAQLLGATSGVVLDYAATGGGLILAPAAPASNYLGPATEAAMFSRASTATYFDKDGILRVAAANEPRVDHDPITKVRRGLLLEGSGINTAWLANNHSSETMPIGGNILANAKNQPAPDGTNNGTLSIEAAVAGEHIISDMHIPVVAGEIFVWSVHVEAAPVGVARMLYLRSATGCNAGQIFNLQTGEFSGSGVNTLLRGSERLPGGRYRVWMCFEITATVNNVFRLQMHNGVNSVYDGDGVSGLIVWGRQIEKVTRARGPSSYIPALTGQTSRAADNCSVNFTNVISRTEGTLVFDLTADELTLGSNNVFGCLQRTANGLGGDSIYLTNNTVNEWQFASYRAGANQSGSVISFSGAGAAKQREKLAITFKDGDFRACRNGGAIVGRTLFTMPVFAGACDLSLSSSALFGWHHKHTYIPRFVSDSELQSLTA